MEDTYIFHKGDMNDENAEKQDLRDRPYACRDDSGYSGQRRNGIGFRKHFRDSNVLCEKELDLLREQESKET